MQHHKLGLLTVTNMTVFIVVTYANSALTYIDAYDNLKLPNVQIHTILRLHHQLLNRGVPILW